MARPLHLAALCCLLLALVLCLTGGGLTARSERIPGLQDSDCNLLFYANRGFVWRSVASGELPLWNPHDLLGYPIYGAGQTALFYPPSWLIYPWMGTGRALFADLTLHLLIFGLSTAFLARRLGLGRLGAWTAAIGVVASPMMALRVHAGHVTVIATIAWLPLVAASLLEVTRGRGRIVIGAISLGLACHAGHVQPLYYLLALGLPLLVAWALWTGRRSKLPALGLMLVLGMGLGSIQMFALAEAAHVSVRTVTSTSFVERYSTRLHELAMLLGAEIFGDRSTVSYWGRWKVWETSPAFGFALSIAAAAGFVLARGSRPRLLGVIVLGSLLVALGLELPFQRLASKIVPGFGSFRAHARILLLGLIGLALLAGSFAEALARGGSGVKSPDDRRRRLLLVIGLVGLTVGLESIRVRGAEASLADWDSLIDRLYNPLEAYEPRPGGQAVALVKSQVLSALRRDSIFSLTLAASLVATLGRPLGPVGALVVPALVVVEYLSSAILFAQTSPPPSFPEEARTYLAGRPAGSRVHIPVPWVPTMPTLLGIDSAGGSVSLMSQWTRTLLHGSQGREPGSQTEGTVAMIRFDGLARAFGVARAVSRGGGHPPPGLEHKNSPGQLRFLEALCACPRAWIAHRVRAFRTDGEALRAMLGPGFDPLEEAVLSSVEQARSFLVTMGPENAAGAGKEGMARPNVAPPDSGPAEWVRLVGRTACSMAIEAQVARRGILVVADSYDPGWRAYDEHGERGLLRVDVALRGVLLDPGHHRLRFVYRPRTLTACIAVTLLSLLTLALLARRLRRRARALDAAREDAARA